MVGDLPDLSPWIREAARVLVPGGQLVYSDFHPAWSARRWRRTFRGGDGGLHAMAFHPHSIDQHLARLRDAALLVRAIREPRAGAAGAPVVAVFHAVKRR
jgi:malonyl-CoA O-methyltransferase